MEKWWGKRMISALLSPFQGRGVSADLVNMGADFAGGGEAAPTYDVNTALSAYAGFPWVYAAMLRRSQDVSRLPARIVRGSGPGARAVSKHPFYALLNRPSTKKGGRSFRAQMCLDYRITGMSYSLIVGTQEPLISLRRLHPGRTRLKVDPSEGYDRVIYNGAGVRLSYRPEDVIIASLPSWEDGPEGLYGTGAILPLHTDLTTDKRAATRAGEMAKRGRPDVLVSPAGEMGEWQPETRDQIKRQLNKLLSDGGALVFSNEMKMEIPTWKPRDMEFEKVRALAREAVLAVTGVPPHMVGLPSANYALAERQEIIYYEGIAAEAEEMADQVWTPLIQRLYGARYAVRFDTSGIAALQKSRSEQLDRVQKWVDLGADPAEAAAYEGLEDGPLRAAEASDTPEETERKRSAWSPALLNLKVVK